MTIDFAGVTDTKKKKVRIYITKTDYKKAMQEMRWIDRCNICEACVVSQAVRRTFKELKLFTDWTDIRTTTCSIYDPGRGTIATLPPNARIIIDEFDSKKPFKPGRQFTLVLEQ